MYEEEAIEFDGEDEAVGDAVVVGEPQPPEGTPEERLERLRAAEEPDGPPEVVNNAVVSPPVETQQVELPTIHILVQREQDKIDCDVVATGDIRATEVESLIKMGLNKWRQKINLPG